MLGSWKASACANINSNGMSFPGLSEGELKSLKALRKKDGYLEPGHYLCCAATAAAVSLGVAFAFNHHAKNLIGFRNVAAVVALGLGVCAVRSDLKDARLINREIKFKELGENNAQKLFKPLGDFSCSVSGLETALTDAFRLMEFHINEGGGQPYADGFIEEATRQAQYITVGQFGQDLRADIQIERFVICLTLAQILSDDRPEKPSALDECNQLIAQPGFVQKLASYMVSDSGCKEENQLIINSDYAIVLEEEMYNLCRAALVTLAVISKNEYMRDKMNEYHLDRRSDAMFYSSIVRCARIDNGLASRLENEMGIDIISQLARPRMLKNRGFGLSDDQITAVTQWSEQYRWYDPLAAEIDALSAPPPVMPAINPASAQRSL